MLTCSIYQAVLSEGGVDCTTTHITHDSSLNKNDIRESVLDG